MAITTSRLPLLPPLLPLLLLQFPMPAAAVDWLVAPSLRLRASYTDNALLTPSAQARPDFITEIAPALTLIGSGPRLHVYLDYTWRKFFYSHQAASDSQQLQASAGTELVRDWLYVDGSASAGRYSVSPFGPQVIDGLPASSNASTVRATTFSPYVRHRFPALGTAELRYARSIVSSGGDLLSMRSDAVAMLFNGEARGSGWNWNAGYDVRRTRDGKLAPQRMERGSVGLRYPFGRKWAATASVGMEKEGYVSSTGKAPQGRFWSLGGIWTPSSRTSEAFSGGRRFFGHTYSLDARLRQRHSSWSLSYSEDITSMPAQFLRLGNSDTVALLDQMWRDLLPDARQRRLSIDAFLRQANALEPELGAIHYFSYRYFLQRQLTLTVARATAKSTLLFGIHAVDRTAQSSGGIDSALLPGMEFGSEERTRQIGGNVGWRWQASSRSGVNVNAGYASVRSLSVPRRDNNATVTAGYSRIVQPKMTASIDLRHTRHSSSRGGDYRENGVSATLNMQF